MKQIIILLCIVLWGYIGWDVYKIYDGDYSSKYNLELTRSGVEISPIDFDKETVDKLNDTIDTLRVDETYKLKLTDENNGQQPLFIDNAASIYDKILFQQRVSNNFNQ